MRGRNLIIGLALGVLLLGSSAFAWSSVAQVPSAPDGEADREEADDPGRVGGAIPRMHQAGACDLVDVSALPGNWTHGSYVSAVAALGDPALIPQAAHSSCGKPKVAGHQNGNGNGPPAHALEKSEQVGPQAEPDVTSLGLVGSLTNP